MDKELNEAIEELKSMKGPYTYSDCEVCDEDCDKCIKNKAIDTVLNRLEEYENQLDLDYVDENYIPKKKIENKIEESKREYNEIHSKHYRDCGILENRIQARIQILQELLGHK